MVLVKNDRYQNTQVSKFFDRLELRSKVGIFESDQLIFTLSTNDGQWPTETAGRVIHELSAIETTNVGIAILPSFKFDLFDL